MKLSVKSTAFFRSLSLVQLLLLGVFTPSLRADDQMAQPSRTVQLKHIYYLAEGKPNVTALLAPPPLPDSPEQAADMTEVRVVCHGASSNDVAIAFMEKKFDIFNFAPAIGPFFAPGKFP
ncbi:MAG TPA: hypothetical protein VN836_04045, partial [Verrucomicrobiae bacterium]|nr:hypothetical protein [Verrucomicrobiae bacterium]